MQLLNIFLMIFLISFVTMGARIITQPEYFANPVRVLALKLGIISKPIITCCVCMPSLWGVGIHFFITWIDPTIELNIYFLLVEIPSASFINGLLWVSYMTLAKKLLNEDRSKTKPH